MGWLRRVLDTLGKDVTARGLQSPRVASLHPPTPPAGSEPVEVYRTFCEHLLAAGDEVEFATFTDVTHPDHWAQVLFQKGDPRMLLNFHYPHAEEPTALLARRGGGLPEGCELQEWDAESMVVFGFPSAVPSEVAAAVDALYRAIHGIGGAYEVTGALE